MLVKLITILDSRFIREFCVMATTERQNPGVLLSLKDLKTFFQPHAEWWLWRKNVVFDDVGNDFLEFPIKNAVSGEKDKKY
jgi:hypothetical protein